MFIDVSSIVKYEGGKREVSESWMPEAYSFNGYEVVFKDPVTVTGEIVNLGQTLKFTGECKTTLSVHCHRCLKPMDYPVQLLFEETLMQEGTSLSNGDSDECLTFSGTRVDLGEMVNHQLMLQLPMVFLCSEQCKGLCPTCGQDLNTQTCKCQGKQIDPRLAVLQKLLDQ